MPSYFKLDEPEKHDVKFYTKEGCCLCDEARAMLGSLARDFTLTVTEIDIMFDSEAYERYKDVIPVVEIDTEVKLGGRFTLYDLRCAVMEVEGRVW